MTNQLPPELFSQRPVRSDFTNSEPSYALRRFITIVVLLSILTGGAYWLWGRKVTPNSQEIPTITADKNYKKRPEQPGGIDIPHQDVQVYQELDSKNSDKAEVDHLLPPPETPQITPGSSATSPVNTSSHQVESLMPEASTAIPVITPSSPPDSPQGTVPPVTVPQATSPQQTSSQAIVPPVTAPANMAKSDTSVEKPIVKSIIDKPIIASTPAVIESEPSSKIGMTDRGITLPASPSSPAVLSGAPSSKPAVKAAVSDPPPVVKEKAPNLTIEQVIKNTSQEKSTGQEKAIQLASVPDQAAAEQMMHKLQAKYASVLGEVQLHIVRADLGSKGVYYRIQGRVSSEQKALSICTSIKKLNSGCLLVSSR